MEFLAENVGLEADCPHCGQRTELLLARPPEEPVLPRRVVVYSVVAVLVLVFGLVGALVALKRAERWAARRKQVASLSAAPATNAVAASPETELDPLARLGFTLSAIGLDKAQGTSLVYATGTLHNTAARQRFGVRLELDLLNADGQKVGSAKDYAALLEPGADWHFKALVVEPKGVTSAKLASLNEDQ